MSTDHRHAAIHLERLLRNGTPEDVADRLTSRIGDLPPSIPGGSRISEETIDRRWQLLSSAPESRAVLLDPQTDRHKECYRQNIENFIGTVKVPIGLAGPLRVNGLFARGDYYVVPLSETPVPLAA